MKVPSIFNQTFDFNLGNLSFSPSYIQAAAIVFLVFLLVLTLARLRRLYLHWSFGGSGAMIFIGFILTLILEGFLILSGRTLLTEIIGWQNAPKPLRNVIIAGRQKMADVLGATEEIPSSYAEGTVNLYDVISQFQSLNPSDAVKFRSMICEP